MKKLMLTAVVILFAMVANAQDLFVGGSVGFWDNSDAKHTSINITPEIGYNLSEAWALGIQVGYAYNKTDESKINAVGVTPYARYSYLTAGPVKLFLDGGFEFETLKVKGGDSYNAWNVGIKPGVSIALNQKFSLVAHFGFLGYKDIDEEVAPIYALLGQEKGWGLKMNGYNLSFGFYYNF